MYHVCTSFSLTYNTLRDHYHLQKQDFTAFRSPFFPMSHITAHHDFRWHSPWMSITFMMKVLHPSTFFTPLMITSTSLHVTSFMPSSRILEITLLAPNCAFFSLASSNVLSNLITILLLTSFHWVVKASSFIKSYSHGPLPFTPFLSLIIPYSFLQLMLKT